jgi:hypothetical protein
MLASCGSLASPSVAPALSIRGGGEPKELARRCTAREIGNFRVRRRPRKPYLTRPRRRKAGQNGQFEIRHTVLVVNDPFAVEQDRANLQPADGLNDARETLCTVGTATGVWGTRGRGFKSRRSDHISGTSFSKQTGLDANGPRGTLLRAVHHIQPDRNGVVSLSAKGDFAMCIAFNSFFSVLAAYIEASANAFVEAQLSRVAGGVDKHKIF